MSILQQLEEIAITNEERGLHILSVNLHEHSRKKLESEVLEKYPQIKEFNNSIDYSTAKLKSIIVAGQFIKVNDVIYENQPDYILFDNLETCCLWPVETVTMTGVLDPEFVKKLGIF